jgi:hypothetical protein
MNTVITRSTESTFTQVMTREDGKKLTRVLDKKFTPTEYGNACFYFHRATVAIEIGNSIEL